jgi:FMN phosphatase YigB (HAD superfamily)
VLFDFAGTMWRDRALRDVPFAAIRLCGQGDRLGLRPVIDAATSSPAAGSCKPDPAIYQVALAKAACPPAHVVFVGGSMRHDVVEPAAAGMRTAWLAAAAAPGAGGGHPDFVITTLPEVLGIVGAPSKHP